MCLRRLRKEFNSFPQRMFIVRVVHDHNHALRAGAAVRPTNADVIVEDSCKLFDF